MGFTDSVSMFIKMGASDCAVFVNEKCLYKIFSLIVNEVSKRLLSLYLWLFCKHKQNTGSKDKIEGKILIKYKSRDEFDCVC